jgi:hypothetical protein
VSGHEEGSVTDRRDRERERQEQDKADRARREEREKRADELREAWRRRHPSERDDEKGFPRKEPPG